MKKIKLNWGKGLVLGMGAFITFIVVLGVQMFRQSPNDFDRQYYEKGLAFDSVYNQEKQVVTDKAQPVINISENSLAFMFTSAVKGSVRFERPADATLDKVINFNSDGDDHIVIPRDGLRSGRWSLTVDWQANNKKYIYKKEIDLP